jgi:hypothetical protein
MNNQFKESLKAIVIAAAITILQVAASMASEYSAPAQQASKHKRNWKH